MAYSIETKEKAVWMRKNGYSYNEINNALGVAKGTLCYWLKDIKLSENAKNRLLKKIEKGQLKASEVKRAKRKNKEKKIQQEAEKFIKNISFNNKEEKLVCSLLYYCEGDKDINNVGFTNSDPKLVKLFLKLFRGSFLLDENKFRISLHLHDYHNKKKQIKFWSDATQIPITQFSKPYLKPNTKKRIRKGYPGCASVRYYDTNIARELIATAKTFMENK